MTMQRYKFTQEIQYIEIDLYLWVFYAFVKKSSTLGESLASKGSKLGRRDTSDLVGTNSMSRGRESILQDSVALSLTNDTNVVQG
jgi:hypothetical protein